MTQMVEQQDVLDPPVGMGGDEDAASVILLIDDDPLVAESLRRMLEVYDDLEVVYCADAGEAIEMAEEVEPKVILLDIIMPDIDGLTVLKYLRANESTRDIPVVALSAREEPKMKARFFQMGGNDYMVKLPDEMELMARARYHCKAYTTLLQRDQAYEALSSSQTKLAEANLALERLASTDALTGLQNRRLFDIEIDKMWRACRRREMPLSVALMDIDFFKKCNDVYGHQHGDEVLQKVASIIQEHSRRPHDMAARYGGEEFVVLFPDTDLEGATSVIERIREAVAQKELDNEGADLGYVTISGGVFSMVPDASHDPEYIVGRADEALYRAKEQGRNRVIAEQE
jgi:two-component system chemotaxis family response regulator WspR